MTIIFSQRFLKAFRQLPPARQVAVVDLLELMVAK
jgi:hypothetical protein